LLPSLKTCRDPCGELVLIDRSVVDAFDDADRLVAFRVVGFSAFTTNG